MVEYLHLAEEVNRTVNTKSWSLFEALVFYLGYLASGLIARLALLLFHATRLALENQQNHALFDGQRFFAEVLSAVESRPMVILLLADLAVVLLLVVVIRARGERPVRYLALTRAPVSGLLGAVGAGVGFRYAFSWLLTLLLGGSATLQSYNQHMEQFVDDALWLVLCAVVLAAPVIEELVFRGALFRALERSFHKGVAIFVPSVLFALAHTDPVQMAYAFVLGLLLAVTRARSGRLLPCIFLHMAFNAANFLQFTLPVWAVMLATIACYLLTLRGGKRINRKKHCQNAANLL